MEIMAKKSKLLYSYKREYQAGAGMILCDSSGGIVFSACRSLKHCCSEMDEEACACMEGVALALQWISDPIIIETDNASLVAS
jgi:hypothetical protein